MRWAFVIVAACSTVAAPVENRVATPLCTRAITCIAACQHDDAIGCARAARFTGEEIGDVPAGTGTVQATLPYERIGCRAGDASACMQAALISGEDAPTAEAAACERGVAEGCQRSGLSAKALALFSAACDRGDAHGCLGAAELATTEIARDDYVLRAARTDERDCEAGDPLACIDRTWIYDRAGYATRGPAPKTWVDRACSLVGEPPTCWHGSQPRVLRPTIDYGDDE